ncbi:MAG TPA: winged helix-turn-helix domain-containing protein [Bryobacteraceae bacterium]|jgi:DNA-binding winged helix-turn-helix (wHTH) protein/tetratricopeptide (TPR) repeat protein|nr:winged helix-turn-helix domain-containing protein [Bryobacteraceae bacterium]
MGDHSDILRFDVFELDTGSSELRRQGERIKLPPQPFRVLELLVRRSGDIVTREEIRERIWNSDTFVDFEQGLNFCIRQIRDAMGDTAIAPRFIETLPRRGYRFLQPVEASAPEAPKKITRLIVLPFRMLRPDPATDFLAFSLPDALTTSLSGLKSLVVRSSLAASRYSAETHDLKTIAAETDVDLVLTGTLLSAGDEIRVTAQLTDAANGTLLCSHSTQTSIGNVFRLQDEFTECIVTALSLELSAGEQRILRQDVPSSAKAYEYYLRANQFSLDSKQWSAARDLYLKCVESDPCYAPAWARLGRIHHVMAKYLPTGAREGLDRAEAAFRQALDLNPDLAIGHKFYGQLEVDLGRAADAIARLIPQAQSAADPEVFAGLVSPLRYGGLLDASVAAHSRAIALEPKIKTSVLHTLFLQRDYRRLAANRIEDAPYIVSIAMAETGRGAEALPVLRSLEEKIKTRMRDFVMTARAMIEGDMDASIAAAGRVVTSEFSDPEGLFYLCRHLAHLDEVDSAIALLERVVGGGFSCYPAMAGDPWLVPLRRNARFVKLLRTAEERHNEARTEFSRLEGGRTLGLASRAAGESV